MIFEARAVEQRTPRPNERSEAIVCVCVRAARHEGQNNLSHTGASDIADCWFLEQS